jgi:ketol-acid reductoisomerase
MEPQLELRSRIFARQTIPELGGEAVVRGGRQLFPRLPEALAGVSQIGVIGWGPQGEAQAQNLRDSLRGSSIRIKVGLRAGSGSFPAARMAGFCEADGTLGEMFEVIGESDLVLLLISDAAQAALFQPIFEALRPGVTLGLSHGFLPAHLAGLGVAFPAEVDVIGVCPKGMGPSVRRLYERARCTPGAGINASVAVEQDATGRATERALAWSIALGAPCSFATTLESEFRSDVVGERGVLLGALHGLVESLYRHLRSRGMDPEGAFRNSCDSITGPISRGISRGGLRGLYRALEGDQSVAFQRAYCAAYEPALGVLSEIYDEVASGNEVRSIVAAGRRLQRFPMADIGVTEMWQVGRAVRASRVEDQIPLHATTAGLYCATMMAQIDLLLERGHGWSEIANESVIEAVDSLNPYMHARGVAFMVDNCSTTARLGCRRWAPVFDYAFTQQSFVALEAATPPDPMRMQAFEEHRVHDVLDICRELRPSIEVAVPLQRHWNSSAVM